MPIIGDLRIIFNEQVDSAIWKDTVGHPYYFVQVW
jgi:hypothetical protein